MGAPQLSPELCAETLRLLDRHGGNMTTAALEAGIPYPTFQNRVRRARARAAGETESLGSGADASAVEGFDPYLVRGVSTYYNRDGDVTGQWVKTRLDDQVRLQMLLDLIERKTESVRPFPPLPMVDPQIRPERLCNLITLTDCHVGMMAWGRESGAPWDTRIAQETLTRCFTGMIKSMPLAGTCVINQLGDFLHYDGLKALTPEHGNLLDADTRFQKMAEVAVDVLEDVIRYALTRHQRVHVIMAEGNHDEASSAWLRILFKRLFRDEPRVTVDDTPLPYYVHQHGKVLLAMHHGHKLKPKDLPLLFAAQFPRQWGASEFRFGHSGHQHHLHEQEYSGMIWTQHPTLSARDAYAARGGWLALRRAIGVTYDAELGEVGRTIVTPDMFR